MASTGRLPEGSRRIVRMAMADKDIRTEQELATRLGITWDHLRRLLRREANPSMALLARLEDVLGLRVPDLYADHQAAPPVDLTQMEARLAARMDQGFAAINRRIDAMEESIAQQAAAMLDSGQSPPPPTPE